MRGAVSGSLLALILIGAAPVSGAPETPGWANLTNARTKDTCKAAARRPLPPADLAGLEPAQCDLVALYDGIGATPDYKSALACALHGKAADADSPFDSDAVLAMLYANGHGVARNDDLAVAYACRAGGAAFEIDGRIAHLLKRKTEGPAAKPFDFCDDITSGYMQGWCTSRGARGAELSRAAKLTALVRPLDKDARGAFQRLKRAHDDYVQAIADHEVDLSGTARAMYVIDAKSTEEDNFLTALQKTLPPARPSAAGYSEVDARLNADYKRLMATKDADLGTVTHDGIKATERSWLKYRDAFLVFAAKAAGRAPRDAVAKILTEQRIARLGGLLGEEQR